MPGSGGGTADAARAVLCAAGRAGVQAAGGLGGPPGPGCAVRPDGRVPAKLLALSVARDLATAADINMDGRDSATKLHVYRSALVRRCWW